MSSDRPQRRVIVVVLTEYEPELGNDVLLQRVAAELNGVDAKDTKASAQPKTSKVLLPTIKSASARDEELATRVSERISGRLEAMHFRLMQRLNGLAVTALKAVAATAQLGQQVSEVATDTARDVRVEVDITIASATSQIEALWKRSLPATHEVVKDLIKDVIKAAVVTGTLKLFWHS